MICGKLKLALCLSANLLVAMTAGQALAEQVKITANTDVSPKGIAAIVTQEMGSTFPPKVTEIMVNYVAANVIIEDCPDLRQNQAKFSAVLDTAIKRENNYYLDDFYRHERNLDKERFNELIGYFLFSIGMRDNDPESSCATGRKQMAARTQLGTFLLD